jgi:hypothetical protein
MKIDSQAYCVPAETKVRLRKWATSAPLAYKSKRQYQKLLERHVAQLSSLREMHYAANRYALLLIFQGMDAAGKDGAIRHVMSGINPQGSDDKESARLIISQAILDTLGALGSSFPKIDATKRRELYAARRRLTK